MKLEISDETLNWFLVILLIAIMVSLAFIAADRHYQREHHLKLMEQSLEQSLVIQDSKMKRSR